MITVSMISAKGGVGKSSCTFHLGGTLARMGRKVLLVDCDAQSSLTQGFIGPDGLARLDPSETIAAAWASDPLPEQIIRETSVPNLSLIPGHRSAARYDAPIIDGDISGLDGVGSVLEAAGDAYDVCLVDCPPQMYAASYAALLAATHVIVPIMCEDYGSTGMVTVVRVIREIQASLGRPMVLGYLLSMYNKGIAIHRAYADTLRRLYGDVVFDTSIPLLATYKESVSARMPVSHYKPKSPAAKAFIALAGEIDARVSPRNMEAA